MTAQDPSCACRGVFDILSVTFARIVALVDSFLVRAGAVLNVATVVVFVLGLFTSVVINRWWSIQTACALPTSPTRCSSRDIPLAAYPELVPRLGLGYMAWHLRLSNRLKSSHALPHCMPSAASVCAAWIRPLYLVVCSPILCCLVLRCLGLRYMALFCAASLLRCMEAVCRRRALPADAARASCCVCSGQQIAKS